jgi:cytochrome P450
VTDFDQVNYFNDASVIENPYAYFDYLREQGPVRWLPHHDVVVVTGYSEAVAVYRNTTTFSSVNAAVGPMPLPFTPQGDDISDLIELHRDQLPMHEHLVSQDPPRHSDHRALMTGLITPTRIRQNQAFMWWLADHLLDEFVANRQCEFVDMYARPFPVLVIADLLGVPESDHQLFRARLAESERLHGQPRAEKNPLAFLDERFTTYIEDRRRHPRDDMLTELATASFPDGSIPDVADIVHHAGFLFIAGHYTTTRLLSSALRILAEQPELQERLRSDRDLIANFIEETLRVESPIKSDFRLTRLATTLGGVDIPAGTTVMIPPGAANRDSRRFECPTEFRPDRPNAREHVAFGRGVHTCLGAPLARVEARVSLERILDRITDIRISDAVHGPAGARHFDYVPALHDRGLRSLHLEFTPESSHRSRRSPEPARRHSR